MEGNTVSFWCQTDQNPTEVMTATCSKTIGNVGTWKPNPVLECNNLDKTKCRGQDESGLVLTLIYIYIYSY